MKRRFNLCAGVINAGSFETISAGNSGTPPIIAIRFRPPKDGYNVRVYVPFGHEWYPYFMRRLAERPANVFFLAKNLMRR